MERLFAAFGQTYADHQEVMGEWYNHYRFAFDASEDVTNSDMALYYLQALHDHQRPPRELIDHNVRIDYGKLRHLVQLDRRLNGNFSRLRQLVEDRQLAGEINPSFPVEALLEQGNFISLLYYFGLLTFAGEVEGAPLLRIPNQTVLRLMYGYLRSGYAESEVFTADTWEVAERLRLMAYRGEWEGFFDFLAAAVKAQAGVRDYLQGEKMIQGFLLAYLNITPYFIAHSEREMSGGFADLFLAPFFPRYPDMGHAYLIELKYLSREKDTAAARREAITQATAQLRRYGDDERVRRALGPARLHRLILVYSGWELVYRATV